MDSCFLDFLNKQDVEIFKSFPLSRLSSIGIGGAASLLVYPKTIESLTSVISLCTEARVPYVVLGRMSNVLVSDSGFDGVVVSTTKINRYSVAENVLTAECGASISKIISELSQNSLGGFENLYGIPGTLGGMVNSNAGAFGTEISDVFIDATVYSDEVGIFTLGLDEAELSYRHSSLKSMKLTLLSARLRVECVDKATSTQKLRFALNRRRETQPYGERSLGSIFKRCGDIPVARLIDELGLKGLSLGGAFVSEKHAGFIVARGNATARDVKELIKIIKERIYTKYKILVSEEIEYL